MSTGNRAREFYIPELNFAANNYIDLTDRWFSAHMILHFNTYQNYENVPFKNMNCILLKLESSE